MKQEMTQFDSPTTKKGEQQQQKNDWKWLVIDQQTKKNPRTTLMEIALKFIFGFPIFVNLFHFTQMTQFFSRYWLPQCHFLFIFKCEEEAIVFDYFIFDQRNNSLCHADEERVDDK